MYIDINDYSITQAIIEDLEAGDYEFSIASVGTDGLQGSYSNSQFITLSA